MNKSEEKGGLVSVIIPTYNREKYIVDAIESALNQDYSNVEVIIVDDHSTDHTATLLLEKYSDDQRVKYELSKENNRGANYARNYGLSIAKGEYCAFLDSDDVLTENSITDRVCILDNHPDIDMVYGDICVTEKRICFDSIQNFNQNKYLMQELSLCCYSVILARMSALRKIYPFEDVSLQAWQDDALVLALNREGCKFYHCGKVCVEMRRVDESITTRHHNMYKALPVLVKKYKDDIIQETSYYRYLLWQLRVMLDYFYTKKEDSNSPVAKVFYKAIIRSIRMFCRLNFRHIYG